VLRAWDRSARLESRGYLLFERSWLRLASTDSLFTGFSPERPLRSDRHLRMEAPEVRREVREALAAAAASLHADGLALDAAVGEVQYFLGGTAPIAFPGGPESTGIYNRVDAVPWPSGGPGHRRVLGGPTHIQVVGFDDQGPHDRSLLGHAQASEPARAPHTEDQSRLFSRGEWIRLAP
jgi:acyl-homoserine-lactone acylase